MVSAKVITPILAIPTIGITVSSYFGGWQGAAIAGGVFGALGLIGFKIASSWYRIVDPSHAHVVVTPGERFVVSSDEEVNHEGRRTYFLIPDWIPWFGRRVRVMDITIKELVVQQETYEENQARYMVQSSTKYRIKNVLKAAETFVNDDMLKEMLKEVIQSSVRAVTVKYDVVDARAKKLEIEQEIKKEMTDDLMKWGLELESFQLVDFQDTDDSSIISDISKRREVEIAATTRERNAEKLKLARIKEAEAEEKARQREIEKDRAIGEQEQIKDMKIAEKQKDAKQKAYEVIQVETIRQAEIDKEKAIVLANQQKETEAINLEKKRLEGEGDRKRAEEQAKGEAAPIREKGLAKAEADSQVILKTGLAEAEAKEKLKKALEFSPEAIRALVAEKVVEMQKQVGIAFAEALANADVKVFSGGGDGASSGFDIGKLMESMNLSNSGLTSAVYNRLARPNDIGISELDLKEVFNNVKSKSKPKQPKSE